MCFSATASFATAALTGVFGVASLARATSLRELPLAAMPLIFAVQQSLEGLLWLALPSAPAGSAASSLTLLYLVIAQVVWPIFAPTASLLVEQHPMRRRLMRLCLIVGSGVSVYLLWRTLTSPHGAAVVDGHIVYVADYKSTALVLAYTVATALPLMLSTHRMVAVMGVFIFVGSFVAYFSYEAAFPSVWCFFAAGASFLIFLHFEGARRRRVQTALA